MSIVRYSDLVFVLPRKLLMRHVWQSLRHLQAAEPLNKSARRKLSGSFSASAALLWILGRQSTVPWLFNQICSYRHT